MRDFLKFIRTAGLIGGGSVALSVISFVVTALEHLKERSVAASVFGVLGILFFCYGSFIAWKQEHKKRLELEATYLSQRPRLLLVVKTSISGEDFRALHYSGATTVFFSIQHLSGRPATEVSIDPIQSETQDFQLRFGSVPYVMPGTSRDLDFEVWEDQIVPDPKAAALIGWDCLLPVFFNTCDLNVRMHHHDVCIRYKDGIEELTQKYRLEFDAKEQQLLPAVEVL